MHLIGASRVLFGSDGPGCDPALEVQKIRMLGLEPDDERLVLGENGARLLGLEAGSPRPRDARR